MIGFMQKIDQEIRDAGEFVDGQGLVDPSEAKTVRLENGAPVATDGPYAEAKESLAGWWIIDCRRGAGDRDRLADASPSRAGPSRCARSPTHRPRSESETDNRPLDPSRGGDT